MPRACCKRRVKIAHFRRPKLHTRPRSRPSAARPVRGRQPGGHRSNWRLPDPGPRRDARMGAACARSTLSGARPFESGDRSARGRQPPHAVLLACPRCARGGRGERALSAPPDEARSLSRADPRAPGHLSGAHRRPAVRRSAGGGLRGEPHAAEGVRPSDPAPARAGPGGALRDCAGPPGPSRLRAVRLPLGRALRTLRRARLLAALVAPVRGPPDDARLDAGARAGLSRLRRRAARAALRSAQGGDPRGPASGGRPGAGESRVPALCRALGFPDPALPAVSGPDQGEGRAPSALRALAARPYQPLVLPPERPVPVTVPPPVPHVVVEQRPLAAYAALAAVSP